MKINYFFGAATILTALFTVGASQEVTAGIKCWTNSEGVRECGNVVPPQYMNKGHSKIKTGTGTGVKRNTAARAKTAEELAEEARLAKEAEEKARREAEAKRLAKEQQAKDKVLLQTFGKEEEILMARDGQLSVIDNRVKLTKKRIEKLRENLKQLHAQAARQERSGKGIQEKLKKDIAKVERQLAKNIKFVEEQESRKKQLTAEYSAKIERYRELKKGSN